MVQAQIIVEHLKAFGDWIPAYKLRSVNTKFGWIGHQGDRVCRKLREQGKIEQRINGRYAEYRTKIEQPQQLTLVK